MEEGREKVIEAARWLRAERRRLGASANLVARLATLIAERQGDPVRIHQQQISDLEHADGERGPRTLRPWFRHVRAAFQTGLIAHALGRGVSPVNPSRATAWRLEGPDGEPLGRIELPGEGLSGFDHLILRREEGTA